VHAIRMSVKAAGSRLASAASGRECPWHGFPPRSLPERLAKAMRYAWGHESHSFRRSQCLDMECERSEPYTMGAPYGRCFGDARARDGLFKSGRASIPRIRGRDCVERAVHGRKMASALVQAWPQTSKEELTFIEGD